MPTLVHPRLRPHLAAMQDRTDPRFVIVWDQFGLAEEPLRVRIGEFLWMQEFNGRRSLRDIQADAMSEAGGQLIPLDVFTSLAERLEAGLYLEGPRFRAKLADPIRPPSCLGCYEADPDALREQLRQCFAAGDGPGLPEERKPDGALRAALVPHIDFARGGTTFAHGFKEVYERSDAALFVIIGTSHYSPHRYTLTRKGFLTPLGIAQTDQIYIDQLEKHYGDGLFEDEIAHLPEHSIELEVVFLQYLYEGKRPIRIVPLVVGPFEDCVAASQTPSQREDIGRMIEALRKTEQEIGEPICYLISGDLAHIGPKFGDADPVEDRFLSHSRDKDHEILSKAEAADPLGYFGVIASEGDRRRICGLPPTYTVLEAIRPKAGKVLGYDQYVHPLGHESVSFASVAFYR
jgi:AmmeMemoRadiSam system protein B